MVSVWHDGYRGHIVIVTWKTRRTLWSRHWSELSFVCKPPCQVRPPQVADANRGSSSTAILISGVISHRALFGRTQTPESPKV